MQRLPLTVQNAYSDLLDRLLDDTIVEIGGKPVLRTIRGRKYWYARSYVGDEEREKYLEPDTAAFRASVQRLQDEIAGLRERQEGRRPLVQMLRVKGVPRFDAATGKVLQALAPGRRIPTARCAGRQPCLPSLPANSRRRPGAVP